MTLVQEAVDGGATRAASCNILELSVRTLERWSEHPDLPDGRAGPITPAANSLTKAEKEMIIEVSNSAPYANLCPWEIVAKLADSGRYLASESSFYRVLKAADLLNHRSKSKPRERKRPKDLLARNPNCVWSWDITYLKSPVKGMYYYLYLTMDVFSRYIVRLARGGGRERRTRRRSDHAGVHRAKRNGGQPDAPLGQRRTHERGDDACQKLQVAPTFSRPSVSDDNPFSESLFKTLKYRPSYPDGAFASIEEARTWVTRFVAWYNTEHLHSGIRFVTPESKHHGEDEVILKKRHLVYEYAKLENPLRWSGKTRNWSVIEEVRLNPGKENKSDNEKLRQKAA